MKRKRAVHKAKLLTFNFKLFTLLAAFVALATLYSVIVPLGEGPDEPGHVRYVFFLAQNSRLPVQRADSAASDVPGEGHQPPLAYALMAPLATWLPADQREFDMPGNLRFTWADGAGPDSELNAVAHGSREYMPWRGFVLAWHLARLVAVGLGAATVLLTYLAARAYCVSQIADRRSASAVPLLAAALVAFNPQFLFISALVTNDALLVTWSAALLWLVVRGQGSGVGGQGSGDRETGRPGDRETRGARVVGGRWSGVRGPVCIGLVLGLALLTKQSALLLVPVALLGVVWPPVRQAGSWAARMRHALLPLLCLLATTALVCGWWYMRNIHLYGRSVRYRGVSSRIHYPAICRKQLGRLARCDRAAPCIVLGALWLDECAGARLGDLAVWRDRAPCAGWAGALGGAAPPNRRITAQCPQLAVCSFTRAASAGAGVGGELCADGRAGGLAGAGWCFRRCRRWRFCWRWD